MAILSVPKIRKVFMLSAIVISGISACGGPGKGAGEIISVEASPWRFSRGGVRGSGALVSGGYGGRLDVIWERSIKEKPQAPLTLTNGAVVVAGSKRKVFLFNTQTGEDIAKYKNRSSPQSGGVIIDSLLYNSTSPPFNYLDCRGVADGKVRWRSVILDIVAPLVIEEERLFALGGDGVAYCFDRFSGDLLWEKKIGGKMIAAPALEIRDDGNVLWIANSYGWIGAYDVGSGKELYRHDTDGSLVSAPAVHTDGTIYFSAQSGHAFSLTPQQSNLEANLDSLKPVNAIEAEIPTDTFALAKYVFKKYALESPSWSSPAIKGKYSVFVDNTGHVYCFDSPQMSKTVWRVSLGAALVASPIIVDDYVVVGLLTGELFTLSLTTGEIVSSRLLESSIKYSPVSDGESIFVATQRKSLYCLGTLRR